MANEFEIQILERTEGGSIDLHPRLVLDDYWRGKLLDVRPAVELWHGDRDWFMGLLDTNRPFNIFHHN